MTTETVTVYRYEIDMATLGDKGTYGPFSAHFYYYGSDEEIKQKLKRIDRMARDGLMDITSIEEVTDKFRFGMLTASITPRDIIFYFNRWTVEAMEEVGFRLMAYMLPKDKVYGDNKQCCFYRDSVIEKYEVCVDRTKGTHFEVERI